MMSNTASLKFQAAAAWSGAAFAVLYGIFWAGFGLNLPPVAPSMSAADLFTHYAQNHSSIIFGECMAATIAFLYAPWSAQMVLTMWRIEGSNPILAITAAMCGAISTFVVVLCPAMWAAAAYRPDIDPGVLRAINDMTFIIFNVTYSIFSLQAILVGICGLMDKAEHKVFPRWVSYWAIFTGLSFIPDTITPMVTSGPMAWNGLVTYWIGFGTFFVWLISMSYYMAAEASRRLALETGGRRAYAATSSTKTV